MPLIQTMASSIVASRGWKRNVAAFVCGVLATLTLAPFFLFPLIIPAFTGLLLLLGGAPSHKRAFWDGWWWGWGFYITGLYWFCVALLTDPEKFAWLIPFALFGVTAVIAIYCGIACWITSRLRLAGLTRIFVFSVVWTCVEVARGHLFTGFPWNLAGYSFGFSDVTLQMAALIGAYGLTWFAVLLGGSFAALGQKRGAAFILIIWGLFAVGAGWGAWRLSEADKIPESERYVPGVMLRLVQANISQFHKWDPKLQMQGLQEFVRLTKSPGLEKVTHIIWPETAVPYTIKAGSPLLRMLGASIPEGKILITGALRDEGEGDRWRVWNSLMALNHDGSIVGVYDKTRLVPFGEFLPFRSLLPKSWLTPVGDTDFSRGAVPHTLEWPGLPPIYPLICYEAIFPELGIASGERPQLLLNVTNDAWFGTSTGPYQHFHMARMRAVEEGIPLVRVANTGISAVVDGFGRIISVLSLDKQGIIDVRLPKARQAYTTYNIFNNIFIQLLLFITVLLILRQQRALEN